MGISLFLIIVLMVVLVAGLAMSLVHQRQAAPGETRGQVLPGPVQGSHAQGTATLRLQALRHTLPSQKSRWIAPEDFPIPVLAAFTVPVAATLFYLAQGYVCLQEIVGTAASGGMFIVFQLVAPVLGAAVCFAYFYKNRQKIHYFFLMWLDVLLAMMGAAALMLHL